MTVDSPLLDFCHILKNYGMSNVKA